MRAFFRFAVFAMLVSWSMPSFATELPPNAVTNLPVLQTQIKQVWAEFKWPEYLAGQVEQETCPSLKSAQCWSERATLKTSRELGIGLGQLTITYNKDGTERFNTFKDVQRLDAGLRNWSFADRFDKNRQLRALVVMDKLNWSKVTGVPGDKDRAAMMFVSYNAGAGRVLSDRRLCKATRGCDQSKWFGNVENTSYLRSVKKVKGYGKTFFETSREYPRNIIFTRSPRYVTYLAAKKARS